MELEKAKQIYKEMKKNKKIIGTVDKEFFFNFAETIFNELLKYQKLYTETSVKSLNESIKSEESNNEQLEALNEGWKKKIEDKILQEWQKCPKNSINDFAITERNNKIQVLQELLEEK